jgi:hypothetical protein
MKSSLFILHLLICSTLFSQKENPIAFFDITIGGAIGQLDGFMINTSVNYQTKHHLFTLRGNYLIEVQAGFVSVFVPIPIPERTIAAYEIGGLYGFRKEMNSFSYHIAAGVSFNHIKESLENDALVFRENLFGVPYEVGFKLYKRKRRPLYLASFIPVEIGPPTALSRSIGLKIIGNFSKRSYIGLGISWGFGFHKAYAKS